MLNVSKKIILSSIIGNAMETYDYVIWGLFALYLSKAFFPQHTNISDMFLMFFITYFLRPFGSLILGLFADTIGRRKVLIFSLISMGACTALIGILPTFKSIGIMSIFCIFFIRIIQSFAIGGEYISSTALLIESCEPNKKGFFGAWSAFGVNLGVLVASLLGVIILKLINSHTLPYYSWRLAFIFSAITMLFGFWIRKSIPDSTYFILDSVEKEYSNFNKSMYEEFLDILNLNSISIYLVLSIVWFGTTITVLIFIYAPIHITSFSHLTDIDAFIINSISLSFVVILIPFFGYLSDFYGRSKLLLLSIFILILIITPYFYYMSYGNYTQILIWHVLIAIPCACVFSITPVLITEIFPLSIRCSLTGFLYSSAACLGGGLTPWLAIKLTTKTHLYISPAFILFLPGILSILTLKYKNYLSDNLPRFSILKLY